MHIKANQVILCSQSHLYVCLVPYFKVTKLILTCLYVLTIDF